MEIGSFTGLLGSDGDVLSRETYNAWAQEMMDWSKKWLGDPSSFPLDQFESIQLLRKVLVFHEHRYYVMNDPLLSDGEYDQLYKLLTSAEKLRPDWITPDSPTQRVGSVATLNSLFPSVEHLVPMLSLENSYNEEDLRDWDERARELTKLSEIEYCVEPKFDGASISVIYENDLLTRAATRGDGVKGEEITLNTKQIRSMPLSAPFSAYGIQQIEIRGEVLINKNNFAAFNENLIAQNLAPLANPRNAASGSLRMKDPKEVSKRNLEVFLYHVSYSNPDQPAGTTSWPKPLSTHSSSLKMLWDLGFRSPVKEMKVFKGIQGVIDYCKNFELERDNLPYEIDGMVIKVNQTELQDKMGMTTHHPRWAMAYKFKARQATSILRKVEFQVGRTGSVTPVAKLDPVPIGGVTVSSVSLFNEEVVKEKDLRIGDTVLVERAGDVIPYIVKSLPELRKGQEEEIVFPRNCPVCTHPLFKPEEEAVWRCINLQCEAQVVERIIHFVSKDAMDIRSFGESNVRKFYDLKLLQDIPGIYHLDFEKISQLEGFGSKSINNLRDAIEKSKAQPLHRLIFALGIRYVGETTAKVLARSVEHLLDLKSYNLEALMALEDIGPKVAGSILQFFSDHSNIALLEKLEAAGISLVNQQKSNAAADGSLSGKTFLFTGTLLSLKRSEAEALVEANGGKILSGVSSKLNFLVAGEEAGSKLEKAKKIPSIRVLSETEFKDLIG